MFLLHVLTCLNVVQRQLNFRLWKVSLFSKWPISECTNVISRKGTVTRRLQCFDWNEIFQTSRNCKCNLDQKSAPNLRTRDIHQWRAVCTYALTIHLCWFSDLHHAVSELWLLHHTADPSAYVSQAIRHVYVTCREKRQSRRTGTLNLLLKEHSVNLLLYI